MKFRVFATRVQPAPPPSPMRLEITLVEERAVPAPDAAVYSRSFDLVERVTSTLADSSLDPRYKTAIMTTCDRAMREWNLAKGSDVVVDIDRKQLRDLDFVPGRLPPSASLAR